MVGGVGIDVTGPSRLAHQFHIQEDLKRDLFTPREIDFCEAQADSPKHFAAFFAAKEAVLKALSIGLGRGLSLREIEVVSGADRRTTITLHGQALRYATKRNIDTNHIYLSMSGSGPIACAVVALEHAKEK